jgi:hypothetical protein
VYQYARYMVTKSGIGAERSSSIVNFCLVLTNSGLGGGQVIPGPQWQRKRGLTAEPHHTRQVAW